MRVAGFEPALYYEKQIFMFLLAVAGMQLGEAPAVRFTAERYAVSAHTSLAVLLRSSTAPS